MPITEEEKQKPEYMEGVKLQQTGCGEKALGDVMRPIHVLLNNMGIINIFLFNCIHISTFFIINILCIIVN